jgi:tetratricopeptide (TPR) repeat protein
MSRSWLDAAMPLDTARPLLVALVGLSAAGVLPCAAASTADDHFAQAERAHYAALCGARKDLDSCSDAVRWSPGDPALVVALADALARAGRLQEAIRDYSRAQALDPAMRGLDAKIKATGLRLSELRHRPKKPAAPPASTEQASAKRYSNSDPEAQSH